jgi:nitrogen fixation NifU-like protein
MDRQAQIDFILDHYENPRHYGALADPSLAQSGLNPGCGDVVTLHLRLDADERILEASFEGQGCTISQAGASLLTEIITGLPLAEAAALDGDALADQLGRDVVLSRTNCAALALNTLRAAEQKWRARQPGSANGALTDTTDPIRFSGAA